MFCCTSKLKSQNCLCKQVELLLFLCELPIVAIKLYLLASCGVGSPTFHVHDCRLFRWFRHVVSFYHESEAAVSSTLGTSKSEGVIW